MTQAGRSGWWIKSSHSLWQLRVQLAGTSPALALVSGPPTDLKPWNSGSPSAKKRARRVWLKWRFPESPPSMGQVWQHCSDQEGAHRCGSSPKTQVASTELGKQSHLLRTREEFPLVPPLPVKANSVNWELTCSVTSEHPEMWDNPANLIPTVTKPAKTHTTVSCQVKWEDAWAQYWR